MICKKCKTDKASTEFYSYPFRRAKPLSKCKICINIEHKEYRDKNKEKSRIRHRVWAKNNPDLRAGYMMKHAYGITKDQYQKLLDEQNGTCKICSQKEELQDARTGKVKRLAIDHSHKTGVVRGLLCNRCNVGLGRFKDDKVLLLKAIEYLNVI